MNLVMALAAHQSFKGLSSLLPFLINVKLLFTASSTMSPLRDN